MFPDRGCFADHVIVSHYHGDHVGNAAELSKRLRIRHFYDHGSYTVEGQPNRRAAFDSYLAVRPTAHVTTPKPGSKIPITGFDLTIVANAGELVTAPVAGMPGAGVPNPLCREFVPRVQDATPENHLQPRINARPRRALHQAVRAHRRQLHGH